MGSSAVVGQHPLSIEDELTARYFIALFSHSTRPLNSVDGSHGLRSSSEGSTDQNSPNLDVVLVVTSLFAGILVLLTTCVRLLSRYFVKKVAWGLDDWTIVPAAISVIANVVMVIIATKQGGIGLHIQETTYHQLRRQFESNIPWFITFYVASGLIKISLTLFLQRITSSNFRRWNVFYCIFLGLLSVYSVCALFVWLFMCGSPRIRLDLLWAAQQPVVLKCLELSKVNQAFASLHIIFDFTLLIASLCLFWKMELKFGRKLWLCSLFSAALFSCICSVARLAVELQVSADYSYNLAKILLWGLGDYFFAIMIANVPGISSFFLYRHRFGKTPPNATPESPDSAEESDHSRTKTSASGSRA